MHIKLARFVTPNFGTHSSLEREERGEGAMKGKSEEIVEGKKKIKDKTLTFNGRRKKGERVKGTAGCKEGGRPEERGERGGTEGGKQVLKVILSGVVTRSK